MIDATCSCTSAIRGGGVCAAAVPRAPRSIPSSKMNRLYIAGFFFFLISVLHH